MGNWMVVPAARVPSGAPLMCPVHVCWLPLLGESMENRFKETTFLTRLESCLGILYVVSSSVPGYSFLCGLIMNSGFISSVS